ncbi:hypothetical protein AeNC1_015072 [Aphanomyces euteiches]|nr:hypothetical protein AeNC1_015072 [Aphanomyces euteiches]
MRIGGEGCIVEIDETSLAKKRKYNRGRVHQDCWLFGVYNDITKKTLSAIIKECIKPGTLAISDKFVSYVSANERHTLENNPLLRGMNLSHQWVNHSENFVNPLNGAHTQTIEGLWETRVKRHMKAMRGVLKGMIPELIDEYLWRSWFFPKRACDEQFMAGICQAMGRKQGCNTLRYFS